jgi:hypothetical protein
MCAFNLPWVGLIWLKSSESWPSFSLDFCQNGCSSFRGNSCELEMAAGPVFSFQLSAGCQEGN